MSPRHAAVSIHPRKHPLIQPDTPPEQIQQEMRQRAGKLLSQVAGYVGLKTMETGLRFRLLEEIAKSPQGIATEDPAKEKDSDSFYTQVWCRSARASEALEMREKHGIQ